MRRTVVFLAALAATLLVIAAAATAAPPAVTISLSRPNVVYGGSVTLSGKVSDNKAGQTVDVLAEPSGATSFSALGSVTTSAGGHWTDVVKPTIETSYQASWKSATSPTVTVKVRPLITLTLVKLSTGSFSTKVTAARSFAGQFVGDLPRPSASWPQSAARGDADLPDRARLHHRHEQGAHGQPLARHPRRPCRRGIKDGARPPLRRPRALIPSCSTAPNRDRGFMSSSVFAHALGRTNAISLGASLGGNVGRASHLVGCTNSAADRIRESGRFAGKIE